MEKDFDNDICAYCENATRMFDGDVMLCKIKGIVKKSYTCKKYTFDPFKHEPPVNAPLPELEVVNID